MDDYLKLNVHARFKSLSPVQNLNGLPVDAFYLMMIGLGKMQLVVSVDFLTFPEHRVILSKAKNPLKSKCGTIAWADSSLRSE